jgi:hypothetical protein
MKHAVSYNNLMKGVHIGWNPHQTLALKFGDGSIPKNQSLNAKSVDSLSIHQSSAPNFGNV